MMTIRGKIGLAVLAALALVLGAPGGPAPAIAADAPFFGGTPTVLAGSVGMSYSSSSATATWKQTTPVAVVRVPRVSFSHQAGTELLETWRIEQPSATSTLLVISDGGAGLSGKLRANGQVAIAAAGGLGSNWSGDLQAASLVLAAMPVADVARFVSSRTLDLAARAGSSADGQFEGVITGTGGALAILAPGKVENEGTIDRPGSRVVLASTRSARAQLGIATPTVVPGSGTTAPAQAAVLNSGALRASGGSVLLHADASPVGAYGAIRSQSTALRANRLPVGGRTIGPVDVTCRLSSGRLVGEVRVNGTLRTSSDTLTTPAGVMRFDQRETEVSGGWRALFVNGLSNPTVTGIEARHARLSCSGGELTPGTPTIAGRPAVGQVLTAAPGTWLPASSSLRFYYQWTRDGAAIAGATNPTYRAMAADAGRKIAVIVTGYRTNYVTRTRTSAAVTIAR